MKKLIIFQEISFDLFPYAHALMKSCDFQLEEWRWEGEEGEERSVGSRVTSYSTELLEHIIDSLVKRSQSKGKV